MGSAGDAAFTQAGFENLGQSGFDDTKFGIAVMETAISVGLQRRRSSNGDEREPGTPLGTASVAAFSTPQPRKQPSVLQTASLTHSMHASELLAGIAEVKLRTPSEGKVGRRRAASTTLAQGRTIVRPPRNRSKSPRPRKSPRSPTHSPSQSPTPPRATPSQAAGEQKAQAQQQRRSVVPPVLPPLPGQRLPHGPPSPHRQLSPSPTSPRGRAGSPVGALSPRSQLSPRGQRSPHNSSPRGLSPRQPTSPQREAVRRAAPVSTAPGRVLPQTPKAQGVPRRSVSGSTTRSSIIGWHPTPDASAFPSAGQPVPAMPLHAPPQPPGKRQPRPPPAELPPPRGLPPPVRRSPRAQLPPQPQQQQPQQQRQLSLSHDQGISPKRVSSAGAKGKAKGRGQNFDTIRVAYKTGGGRQSRRSTPNLPPPSSFRQMAAEREAANKEAEAVEALKRAAFADLAPPVASVSPAAYRNAGSSSPAARSCESLHAARLRRPPG